ncbi:DUF1992 domain-containing protein [Desulfofustis limnaeus]|jgi:hypothetical protein|uniref:DUF1992 domain-containing protein n=1 Tax=Desulfofustis limnaeus TaxID=2740163 RepID=A0ABN6M221_9BACT|nr:DUF1992 domain-containing protein [Desulfofustis limnaeus]MDX9894687.1 DUF1992 domain-containing protein [Desulfofustis sp.]BDD86947.1 DUF1992 domain-containing protein [Desulfofustis limnaeus]
MYSALALIAEQRISQAIEDGTLRTDGWRGRPLPMNTDPFVPEDLKMAYKVLKNSGYLPPEVEMRKEVNRLEDLISKTEDAHQRLKQMKKLNVLLMKIDQCRARPTRLDHHPDYYRKIVERL